MLASATGKEEIELAELVEGCMKMRGAASSLDLPTMLFEVRVLEGKRRHFQAECTTKLEHLESIIGHWSKEDTQLVRTSL